MSPPWRRSTGTERANHNPVSARWAVDLLSRASDLRRNAAHALSNDQLDDLVDLLTSRTSGDPATVAQEVITAYAAHRGDAEVKHKLDAALADLCKGPVQPSPRYQIRFVLNYIASQASFGDHDFINTLTQTELASRQGPELPAASDTVTPVSPLPSASAIQPPATPTSSDGLPQDPQP